jgi:hypothetical protein
MTPPPLSPAYVKDTIAALTASRRSLGIRLDSLDLFSEKAPLPNDPVEIQLLFAARDDYLTATQPGAKAAAMAAMSKLLYQAREACGQVASEMNRLLVAAMTSETAQKKITAMVKIAERKSSRTVPGLTLSDLMPSPATGDPTDGSDTESGPAEEASGAGCADELQAESRASELSPIG